MDVVSGEINDDIAVAMTAITKTLTKHEDVIHPVHEYLLKQALTALKKMYDGGLR